jgi:hypothetical protein
MGQAHLKHTILIVEDDAELRNLQARMRAALVRVGQLSTPDQVRGRPSPEHALSPPR